MGVRFKYNDCIIALRLWLMNTLKKMQKEYMNYARSAGMGPKAREELSEGDFEFLSDYIAITVVGGPWVAMDEYGTGSEIDETNPALAEYIKSDLFNPIRRTTMQGIGLAKVGRGKGSYKDIFGKTVVSSGGLAGVNLEELAKRGELPSTFLPTVPTRALRTTAEWMKQGRVAEILSDDLAAFPWGRFLVATKD